MRRGRFLQLLDMSLSPCCPYPPRRSDRPLRSARGLPYSLRPCRGGSASGVKFCRGHHWVHMRCGPVTRSPSRGWLGRSASSDSFPPRMRPKLRRFPTLPPVGLTPTEHVCLSWTHSAQTFCSFQREFSSFSRQSYKGQRTGAEWRPSLLLRVVMAASIRPCLFSSTIG